MPPSAAASAAPELANADAQTDVGQRGVSPWAVLALVGVGTFMTTLDTSIVNISLPAIARAFGTQLGGVVEWVIIAYLVVIAALLLTFGRLSDAIGRKPVWLAGLAVFTLGSAICGFAPSLPVLIGARAFQGIGGALIFAPSVALLTDAFPPERRGQAIGLNAIAVSLGVAAGPTLGGFITEGLSWRWIFFINVPVGVVAFVAALRVLHGGKNRAAVKNFDFAGAALLAVGLGLLTMGLSFGQEWGWTSPGLLGCVAVALVALAALVVVERRAGVPNIDLDLFKQRAFAAALTSLVLSFLALFAVGFLMPFYFENVRQFSPALSGLLLTPLALAIAVAAPVSGTLSDRIGARWLASSGLAIASIGLVLLAQIDEQTPPLQIVWRLALLGFGAGLFQSPNNRALMDAAPRSEQGEASGVLGTGRVIGQSLSVAIAGAMYAALGFRAAMLTSAAIAAIGIITSLVRSSDTD
jgi:EmrB/QacA subfamily drug resistance transporter